MSKKQPNKLRFYLGFFEARFSLVSILGIVFLGTFMLLDTIYNSKTVNYKFSFIIFLIILLLYWWKGAKRINTYFYNYWARYCIFTFDNHPDALVWTQSWTRLGAEIFGHSIVEAWNDLNPNKTYNLWTFKFWLQVGHWNMYHKKHHDFNFDLVYANWKFVLED